MEIEKFKDTLSKLSNIKFIEILQRQVLNLDDNDLAILKKTKISGSSLLLFTKEDFYKDNLATGPTIAIMEYIRKLKEGILIYSYRIISYYIYFIVIYNIVSKKVDKIDNIEELYIEEKEIVLQIIGTKLKGREVFICFNHLIGIFR